MKDNDKGSVLHVEGINRSRDWGYRAVGEPQDWMTRTQAQFSQPITADHLNRPVRDDSTQEQKD